MTENRFWNSFNNMNHQIKMSKYQSESSIEWDGLSMILLHKCSAAYKFLDGISRNMSFIFAYHWLECDVAILFEGCLAFFLSRRPIIGNICHMTFFLVAMMTFNSTVVNSFFNLWVEKRKEWIKLIFVYIYISLI